MKISYLNLLLLITHIVSQFNEWIDPITKTYYNYNGLRREINNPWCIKKESGIFSDVFHFNFGTKLIGACHKGEANVVESMEVYGKPTPTCSLFGNEEFKDIKLLNPLDPYKGIMIKYMMGDKCSSKLHEYTNKSTTFILQCSEKQDETVFYSNLVQYYN